VIYGQWIALSLKDQAMQRLINAFYNSIAAFRQLIAHEKAFQQEVVVILVAIPLAFLLSPDGLMRIALIGSLVLVVIVEVLNTGIEAACNAISREFLADIKIAKDCGSLAVLLAIALASSVWGLALWRFI
jgi:diacylglycerol kinase (ATP)